MTGVADTRLLLTFHFPPNDDVKARVSRLMNTELSAGLLIPSIVWTEYIKIAGAREGRDAAENQLRQIEDRGAKTVPIEKETGRLAGRLLLKHRQLPIGDALIAATAILRKTEHVVTDDPHYDALNVKTRWL